jgi:hypothetical protein
MRRSPSSKVALSTTQGAASSRPVPIKVVDPEPFSDAYEGERLRRCHLCAAYLSPNSELYLLDDAVYCCAPHRARAAAVDKALAAGWELREPRNSIARNLPTATGVGLAASHRSWWSLDDLTSEMSASTSDASVGSHGSSRSSSTLPTIVGG